MNTEKETLAILFLLSLVLAPLWFFALYSAESQQEVALSQTEGVIDPTGRFLPTPVAVNELVAGVITWVALFVLMGMIFYTHRLMRSVGQSAERGEREGPVAADGGSTADGGSDRRAADTGSGRSGTDGGAGQSTTDGGTARSLPSYILTDDRRIVDYWPAEYSTAGLVAVAVASGLAVVFAVLFTLETTALARTQYLGVYGGFMLLSLGAFVASYATWFIPSLHIVEERAHEEIAEGDSESEGNSGAER